MPGRRSETIPDDFGVFGEDDFDPPDEDAAPADLAPPAARRPPEGEPRTVQPRAGTNRERRASGGPPPPPPPRPDPGRAGRTPEAGAQGRAPAPARRRQTGGDAEARAQAEADAPFHPSTIPPGRRAGGSAGAGSPPPRAAAAEGEAASIPVSGDPVAVFLAACGLEESGLSDEAAERLFHRAGAVMREMVRGVIEVLRVRASIRDEFRVAERTMIQPTANNPLKFSVDVDDALQAMLIQPRHGYLPPEQATREAFRDLRAHQFAVMAGMQVALTALLNRFNPEALERRLEQQSVWESILPSARKAKYWELFRELYSEIAREAEDDFSGLFGNEFAKAYEEQLRKL